MSVYGSSGLGFRFAHRFLNDGYFGMFGEDCSNFRLPPDWRYGMTMQHYRPVWKRLTREMRIALRRLRNGMEVYRCDGMPVIDEGRGNGRLGAIGLCDFESGDADFCQYEI